MPLPGSNIGINSINGEARYGGSRQTSASEVFVNVIEQHGPQEVQWDRLKNKYAAVTMGLRYVGGTGNINWNVTSPTVVFTNQSGQNVGNYTVGNFPYAPNYALFSIDIIAQGWGPVQLVRRIFFDGNSNFQNYFWLGTTKNSKYHNFYINFNPGFNIGCFYNYAGGGVSTTIYTAFVGLGKCNYWAPGTAPTGPGGFFDLDNSVPVYEATYYNNNL